MESRTQGSRPRPRTRGTGASVSPKKRPSKIFFQAISTRGNQKRSSQTFREVSAVFLHNFKNEQIPTIVGTDANVHRTIWDPVTCGEAFGWRGTIFFHTRSQKNYLRQ